jgi:hypothetical protein
LAVTFSLLFICIGFLGHISNGFPGRLSDRQLELLSVTDYHYKQRDDFGCNLDWNEPSILRGCIRGAQGAIPSYALFGDSHAAVLAHELSVSLRNQNKSFVQYTKNACPPIIGVSSNYPCINYPEKVLKDINDRNIKTVIVSASWGMYVNKSPFNNHEGGVFSFPNIFSANGIGLNEDVATRKEAILKNLNTTLNELLKSNRKIILVYPIPLQGWDIPRVMVSSLMDSNFNPSKFNSTYESYLHWNKDIIDNFDRLGERNNLVRVRPDEFFCNKTVPSRCISSSVGKLYYYDQSHLTNDGAKLLIDKALESGGVN